MNYSEDFRTAFNKLRTYCEKENFKGWDPYDGLNSKLFQALPFLPKNKLPRLAWIQFFKRSFINFRRLAIVKKGINPKGVALFVSAYCTLLKADNIEKDELKIKITELSDLLLQLQSTGYSGACWGYNFDWQSKAFFLPKYTPTIVASTYSANALLDAYEATGNTQYLDTALSTKKFIVNDLNRTTLANGNFAFSYSPLDHTSVFNASLLGAKLLSRIYSYTKEEELTMQAKKAVEYCVSFQNSDGSWYYSTLPFHQWIDNFHTGFNLECIYEYGKYTGDKSFLDSFHKGMEYYLATFFDEKGRSKYYSDNIFPVDVHAPAQLIVTLCKVNLFEKDRSLADRVLNWTIQNMQSSKGYFYYQKRKLYTNRVAYMRWTQAWMFYGLAIYLSNDNRSQLMKP
ncbi:MAG: delta-aminolevulinic acid dehydratase [Bacteroidetes bacterium]|nr:delta-aminolevulinic acid dehydratase [Bacteroidota bacterium]MBS1631118.1 delta-aminolevulinic acid dehydratase [Bacteroidota bacterium]